MDNPYIRRQEQAKAAAASAKAKGVPLTVWPEDVVPGNRFHALIPFLSNRTPEGYKLLSVRDDLEPTYPYDFLFVDSSGFGAEGEPALTQERFRAMLAAWLKRGEAIAIGVWEVGQFQVYIAVYRPPWSYQGEVLHDTND